jgi:predicted nucleic acid-binding protein
MNLPGAERGRRIFIDTSAFYGKLDKDDQWHGLAEEGFRFLARQQAMLFTSDLVVAETYRLVQQRRNRATAVRWLATLSDINIIYHNLDAHIRTVALLGTSHYPVLTYTDASSIVVAQRLGIPTVFSFDSDFEPFGLYRFPPIQRNH